MDLQEKRQKTALKVAKSGNESDKNTTFSNFGRKIENFRQKIDFGDYFAKMAKKVPFSKV